MQRVHSATKDCRKSKEQVNGPIDATTATGHEEEDFSRSMRKGGPACS